MAGKSTWIIGSAPDCDVVIDRDTVSSHHCQLAWVAPVFVLEDLRSTNGTSVNGQRITSLVRVTRADEILLGSRIPMPWPDSQIAGIRDTVTIGREPDNDIVLDYPMISGYHAQLIVEGGRTFLQDAGSANGIAVGSPDRTVKRTEISSKDTVYFGSFEVLTRELFERASRKRQQSHLSSRPNVLTGNTKSSSMPLPSTLPTSHWITKLRNPSVSVTLIIAVSAILGFAIYSRPGITPTTPTSTSQSSPSAIPSVVHIPPTQSVVDQGHIGQIEQPHKEKPVTTPSGPDRIKRNRAAVLWVGIRVREPMGTGSALFPLATAFAVKPKVLLTTGWIASELERHSKIETRQVIAFLDGDEIPVQDFRIHPKYNAQEPTSDISVENNLGTLKLKYPVEICDLADSSEITSLGLESPLSLIGFKTTLGPKEPYDPLKVTKDEPSVKLLGTALHRPNSPPVYKVSFNSGTQQGLQPLNEGAPIFGTSGRVIGVLVPTSQTLRMVTTSATSPLLTD